jgi:hypothetical protein
MTILGIGCYFALVIINEIGDINRFPASSVSDTFKLILRMYLSQPQVLNGTWQYPTLQRMGR